MWSEKHVYLLQPTTTLHNIVCICLSIVKCQAYFVFSMYLIRVVITMLYCVMLLRSMQLYNIVYRVGTHIIKRHIADT